MCLAAATGISEPDKMRLAVTEAGGFNVADPSIMAAHNELSE